MIFKCLKNFSSALKSFQQPMKTLLRISTKLFDRLNMYYVKPLKTFLASYSRLCQTKTQVIIPYRKRG